MEMETANLTRARPGSLQLVQNYLLPDSLQGTVENNFPLLIAWIFSDFFIRCVHVSMIREELPVEALATDGNYLFRRVGVRCNWESFHHFVPLRPIQNNM
jgi:hypothetical protein